MSAAELNSLMADASRYRFLRENHAYTYSASLAGPREVGISFEYIDGRSGVPDLDEAIDTAMTARRC